MDKVRYICGFLKEGASLGVQGEGQWPSAGKNNSLVLDFDARVADSLQGGIEDGYLCGPLTKEEVDMIWPEGVKISPMMVRLKPNGSARIIMDMSWPKKVKLGEGKACSPNEGMRDYVEYEEVQMTTDAKFKRAMYWAGQRKPDQDQWVAAGGRRGQSQNRNGRPQILLHKDKIPAPEKYR